MYVQIRTLEPLAYAPLTHAPGVQEVEYIKEQLASVPREGPLCVAASYRGWELYLNDGTLLTRTNPPSGGNGYASGPLPDTEEECLILFEDKTWHKGLVYFFS